MHLCETYEKAEKIAREEHVPVLVHVEEVTQPQGHSTSGSHERYKSKERLAWEAEYDGIKKMREWILKNSIANEKELDEIEESAKQTVQEARNKAWENYLIPIKQEIQEASALFEKIIVNSAFAQDIIAVQKTLSAIKEPIRKDIH